MNYKHGLCKTRLYRIWCKMKERCYNEKNIKYKDYGGRGIKICEDWLSDFAKFYDWSVNNGYNDELTLDRIDFNGNYEPKNCHWATQQEQQNNRRDNVHINVNGKDFTISQLAKLIKSKPASVAYRLKHGWSIDDIINKPFENTKERLITFNGKSQSINAWARETGISKITIRNRLNRYGWSIKETLTIIPKKR